MMERLKQKRIEKGLSFQAMASLLGISKTYYWQIEHGLRRLSYDMAIKIAAVFNLKPDELFYFQENDKEE